MSRELPTPTTVPSLAGKRVLLRCEDAPADTIQFIRYASLLREIASEVIVQAPPDLVPLLTSVRGIDRFGDGGFDVELDVADLDRIFDGVPAEIPYLHAEPLELPDDHRFLAGVAWRADGSEPIPFALIRRLAAVTGVTFYALQSEVEPAERNGPFVVRAGREDLLGTARLIRALDLVITVDSLHAHLAGALGVPVWKLAAEHADWRCASAYPSMRLYRNTDGWESLVAEVVRHLRALTRRPHIRIDVDDHSTYLPLTQSL